MQEPSFSHSRRRLGGVAVCRVNDDLGASNRCPALSVAKNPLDVVAFSVCQRTNEFIEASSVGDVSKLQELHQKYKFTFQERH